VICLAPQRGQSVTSKLIGSRIVPACRLQRNSRTRWGKNKSSTDRCRDRWNWFCGKKGFGLRCLASHPAEVAVVLTVALIALQSLEYRIHSVFLDRLPCSSGEKFNAGFRHRVTRFELVDVFTATDLISLFNRLFISVW
jgi:hypothetical protein